MVLYVCTRYARPIAREDVSAKPDIRCATLLRIVFHHGPFICASESRWTDDVDRREEVGRSTKIGGRKIARAKSAPEHGSMRPVKSLIVIDAHMRKKRIDHEGPIASSIVSINKWRRKCRHLDMDYYSR